MVSTWGQLIERQVLFSHVQKIWIAHFLEFFRHTHKTTLTILVIKQKKNKCYPFEGNNSNEFPIWNEIFATSHFVLVYIYHTIFDESTSKQTENVALFHIVMKLYHFCLSMSYECYRNRATLHKLYHLSSLVLSPLNTHHALQISVVHIHKMNH